MIGSKPGSTGLPKMKPVLLAHAKEREKKISLIVVLVVAAREMKKEPKKKETREELTALEKFEAVGNVALVAHEEEAALR